MPKHAEQLNNPAAETLRVVDDEELDGVVGGSFRKTERGGIPGSSP